MAGQPASDGPSRAIRDGSVSASGKAVCKPRPGGSFLSKGSVLTVMLSVLFWVYVALHSLVFAFPGACLVRAYHIFFDSEKREMQHRYTTWWCNHYNWVCPFVTINVEGREVLDALQDKAVVFVCNHQSTLDIMIMYRLSWHFKWVSKSSNFRIPLIGWNMGLNDYVPVTRGNADSIEKMFAHCKRHLSHGSSLVFFPEGSRSTDGTVKEFKHGAFTLASEAGVPIVPLVIDGSTDCLTAGKGTTVALFNGGGWAVSIKVLPPVLTTEHPSVDGLTAAARASIVNELSALQARRMELTEGKGVKDKAL